MLRLACHHSRSHGYLPVSSSAPIDFSRLTTVVPIVLCCPIGRSRGVFHRSIEILDGIGVSRPSAAAHRLRPREPAHAGPADFREIRVGDAASTVRRRKREVRLRSGRGAAKYRAGSRGAAFDRLGRPRLAPGSSRLPGVVDGTGRGARRRRQERGKFAVEADATPGERPSARQHAAEAISLREGSFRLAAARRRDYRMCGR